MSKTEEFEYQEKIKQLEHLNSRLRFANDRLQNEFNAYKTLSARFVANTLNLLLGLGINFQDIQVYYEQVSRDKNYS